MKIIFKHFPPELGDREQGKIERRLQKFSKYVKEHNDDVLAEFEVTHESSATQSPKAWRGEVNLSVKGELYNAVAHAESPLRAAEKATDELKSVLLEARGKQRSIDRKKSRLWKLFS